LYCASVSFESSSHQRDVHSFPTRRSSDLIRDRLIKEIELSSHCYLKILPQLETVTVSATEQLRRSSADEGDIDWDDYTEVVPEGDRKSTRLNSSHVKISYAVFCLKKKINR